MHYDIDAVGRQPEPALSSMSFKPGAHRVAYSSPVGQEIYKLITSRAGVAMLVGATVAAPSRPPIVALEPFIERTVGSAGFTHEMKKFSGKVVRQVIEALGGRWIRRGIKVTVRSRYTSASIYAL